MVGLSTRALAAAACLAAWLAARSRPAHRDVAAGLTLALLLDLVRSSGLPPRAALALYLATPAISAALALRLAERSSWPVGAAWCGAAAWCRWAPEPRAWWLELQQGAFASSILVQLACAPRLWTRRDLSGRCALVLLAGDVALLLGPLWLGTSWDVVRLQVNAISSVIIVAHAIDVRRVAI